MSVTNWIFAGKCRNCGNKEVWHSGTSDNFSGGSFVDLMKDRLLVGTSHWCEKCKASIIHDVIFYGAQADYQHLIDEITK